MRWLSRCRAVVTLPFRCRLRRQRRNVTALDAAAMMPLPRFTPLLIRHVAAIYTTDDAMPCARQRYVAPLPGELPLMMPLVAYFHA